jgi:hypothetical protein
LSTAHLCHPRYLSYGISNAPLAEVGLFDLDQCFDRRLAETTKGFHRIDTSKGWHASTGDPKQVNSAAERAPHPVPSVGFAVWLWPHTLLLPLPTVAEIAARYRIAWPLEWQGWLCIRTPPTRR